jgi:hypothetical protein
MLFRDVHGIDIHAILEPALLLRKFDIISTHLPLAHATIICERPVFEAIASLPFHSIVLVLVLIPELDSYLVVREREQLFTQAIGFLLLPFGGQEVDNGLSTDDELVTVTPDGVVCVRFGDGCWVPWHCLVRIGLYGLQDGMPHWVFQRSWAFFTFALAVSSVKGGASDMVWW